MNANRNTGKYLLGVKTRINPIIKNCHIQFQSIPTSCLFFFFYLLTLSHYIPNSDFHENPSVFYGQKWLNYTKFTVIKFRRCLLRCICVCVCVCVHHLIIHKSEWYEKPEKGKYQHRIHTMKNTGSQKSILPYARVSTTKIRTQR